MKTLVVYDSVYGNTRIIAQAIGQSIPGDVQVLRARQVDTSTLESADLLIVGTPTHGGGPTEAVQRLLEEVGPPVRKGAKVATFDTRFAWRWLRIFGFPAPKMAEALVEKGWTLTVPPEGFFVKGAKQGPLKAGETERAAAWARGILESVT
jgi:flavodoxin